jgi:microcystin degradation protein MlrC
VQSAERERIEAILGAEVAGDWLSRLRRDLPGRVITICDAADMSAGRPYREYPHFDLYLVDGAAHCWQLTLDAAAATGLVVARRREARAS